MCGEVRNLGRYREDVAGKIDFIFAQLCRRFGDGRSLLRGALRIAYEILKLRRMASGRRIQVSGWATDSPLLGFRDSWGVVARNGGRAGRRWLWELAQGTCKPGEQIRPESGGVTNEPSDDELLP